MMYGMTRPSIAWMLPSIPVVTAVQNSLSPPRSMMADPMRLSYADETTSSRNDPM